MKSAPVSRFKARYDLNLIFNLEQASSATSDHVRFPERGERSFEYDLSPIGETESDT